MKAGLQQIPIQGAAPRLAGNREWDGLPMPTRFWAILAVAFGVSLSVIDGAIANVALPTMARMLGISSANSIWIVNAYQLAIVGFGHSLHRHLALAFRYQHPDRTHRVFVELPIPA